ncbi:SnoaL-like domain-containing protein [Elsinoe fawcettii]|nr:SnoaL-like domain-containing protein [Elsinoe fawcettii]
MKATTEGFLYSFNGDWQPDATTAYRSADCQQRILPSTVGHMMRNREEWTAYFKTLAPMVKDAKMTIDDYISVPDERKVVCRSSMTASTAVGPFSNEYVWFFDFDEEGKQITNIVEFLDSAVTQELRAKIAETRKGSSN